MRAICAIGGPDKLFLARACLNAVFEIMLPNEGGKLFFKKVQVAGTEWYFASKPQHLHREGQDFIDRAVLSIHTKDEYFSHDGH